MHFIAMLAFEAPIKIRFFAESGGRAS
nr:MHYT domain-containing protein [Pseudomonas boanensis]